MHDTMESLNGAGLAAPQIGVSQQVVIFGVGTQSRAIRRPRKCPTPCSSIRSSSRSRDEMEEGWEGCLSVPGMRGLVPRYTQLRYRGFDQHGKPHRPHRERLPRTRRAARSRSSASASCTRCGSATCATSVSTRRCSRARTLQDDCTASFGVLSMAAVPQSSISLARHVAVSPAGVRRRALGRRANGQVKQVFNPADRRAASARSRTSARPRRGARSKRRTRRCRTGARARRRNARRSCASGSI